MIRIFRVFLFHHIRNMLDFKRLFRCKSHNFRILYPTESTLYCVSKNRSLFSTSLQTESESNVKQIPTESTREDYWNPPSGITKIPWYYRMNNTKYRSVCKYKWLKDESISDKNISSGARLHDYYKMQKIVKWLPTIKEKVDFVNPYERKWQLPEETWHRKWMQPLVQPRKAWSIPPVPPYYDSLNFYKFITKCRLINIKEATEELAQNYYKSLHLPTAKFEKKVEESLAFWLQKEQESEMLNHTNEVRQQNRSKFLRSLVDDAHLVLAYGNPKLIEHRISHNPRCESFWIRAGFMPLYDNLPIWETESKAWEPPYPKRKIRLLGDDRRRLGELSFTMRDQHVIQVRTKTPLKNLFPMSDRDQLFAPLFPANFDLEEEIIYSPQVYNLKSDEDILWQCPGYHYDGNETHKYGRFAIKDISQLQENVEYWGAETRQERNEMLNECVNATAVVSLFTWLNAQAHCLGYTQYTEIQEPLTSQMVLTDGHQFWFAVAQLNTLAINIEVEGFYNRRTNCCYVDGPYKLYKTGAKSDVKENKISSAIEHQHTNLNPAVLERLLQMCVV